MYQIDSVAELVHSAGIATLGKDLFLYHSPTDVTNCIILYPSNDPPIVDPEWPGYYIGKFQTIVRNTDYVNGFNICKALSNALTLYNTETDEITIRYIRPMYQARAYRRADSGLIEFSVTFDIRYIVKAEAPIGVPVVPPVIVTPASFTNNAGTLTGIPAVVTGASSVTSQWHVDGSATGMATTINTADYPGHALIYVTTAINASFAVTSYSTEFDVPIPDPGGTGRDTYGYPNRYNAQLGLGGISGYGPSRYLTNLLASQKFGSYTVGNTIGSDNMPYLTGSSYMMDPTCFNINKGSHRKMPGGTGKMLSTRSMRPYPMGAEAGKWIAMYSNRNEVRMSVNGSISNLSGPFFPTAETPICSRTNGVMYFFYHTWYKASPTADNGIVNWSCTTLPDVNTTGGDEAEFWMAEIHSSANDGTSLTTNPATTSGIGWDWIYDPVTTIFHPPSMEDIKMFGCFRFMDLCITNAQNLAIPVTAATQAKFGSSTCSINGAIVETPTLVITVGGLASQTLTFALNPGIAFPQPSTTRYPGQDAFDTTLNPNGPWYPAGANANDLSIIVATPSSSITTTAFHWDHPSKTWTITPAVIGGVAETWNTVRANWQNYYNGANGYTQDFFSCAGVNNIVVSGALGTIPATAIPRTYFTGGRTTSSRGEFSKEMIALMLNYAKTDGWVNCPSSADETFCRDFYGYLNDNLWTGATVYVEVQNETWNYGFLSHALYTNYGASLLGNPAQSATQTNKNYIAALQKLFIDKITWIKDEVSKRGNKINIVAVHADNIDTVRYGQGWTTYYNDPTYSPYATQWMNLVDAFAPTSYWSSTLYGAGTPVAWNGAFVKATCQAGAQGTATFNTGSNQLTVTGYTFGRLSVGDTVTYPGGRSLIVSGPTDGGNGVYTLSANSGGTGTSLSFTAQSTILYVTAIDPSSTGSIAVKTYLEGTGITTTYITALGTGTGGVGSYTLNIAGGPIQQTFSPRTAIFGQIYSDGMFVSYNNNIYLVNGAQIPQTGLEPGTTLGAALYYPLSAASYKKYGMQGVDRTIQSTQLSKANADQLGKRLMSYEGGSHDMALPNNNWNTSYVLYNFIQEWFHSAECGQCQEHWIANMYATCGNDTVIPQFGDSSLPDPSHPWDFQDYRGAPDSISPRRTAWKKFVAGTLIDPGTT